jgi:N-succinyldiaminopimelate aminotransferase
MRRPVLASRLRGFGTTIFAEMTALAAQTGALNLGQGFPDTDGPAAVLDVAAAAVRSGSGFNQYPPGLGLPELRQAIAAHQQRFYGLDYDPDREVLVTAGATEAIAASLLALLDPGDEVVAFEPFYDSYAACISMAGAVRKPVTLRTPDFALDLDRLRAAFTDRTRLVLLNSPHNPTGKVFTRAELDEIARLAIEHDVLVVTDEVYEHLVFDTAQHVPIATLPGMAQRTLSISSAGKTFSVTGWKIGWVCGPAPLVAAVRAAKQFLTFVGGAPFQPAVAHGLRVEHQWVAAHRTALQGKQCRLATGLRAAGFGVCRSEGTYFICADIRPLGHSDGLRFCRDLPARAGVVAVPVQVFADDRPPWQHLVRFAFCKRDEVLDEAINRLASARL